MKEYGVRSTNGYVSRQGARRALDRVIDRYFRDRDNNNQNNN